MNFTDKNHTNLLRSIEENSPEHLKMNGLILSYEKKEALEGLKYVITLPEKGTLSRDGMEGPEKKDGGIGKER